MKLFSSFKTPRVIQMEAAECGAAALGIILGYHGRFEPLEELRERCGVSRDGVNVYDLTQAAEFYGLESEVYECPSEEVIESTFPLIAFWKLNHFIVIEKIVKDRIFINDPASGYHIISRKEFSENYSGILIEFNPKAGFEKKGHSQNFFFRILEKLLPFKTSLTYLFFIQVFLAIIGLTIPVFSQIFIDKFFNPILPEWDWQFLSMIFGVMVVVGVITWIQQIFLNRLQSRFDMHMSMEFLGHLLKLPALFFTQRFGSEIVSRTRFISRISEILTGRVVLNSFNLLLISSYWIIMFLYSPTVTLIAGVIAIFNLALIYVIGRKKVLDYGRLQQSEAKTIGHSFDALEHIETMKGMGNEDFFYSRIANCYVDNLNIEQEIGKKDIWLSNLSSISQSFSTVALLGVGCWQIMKGALTLGELIALQILLNNFLQPISNLVYFSTDFHSVEIDIARIDDVQKAWTDPYLEKKANVETKDKLEGKVELVNIDFGYQKLEEPFINKFKLTINPGEILTIGGKVGTGKSTIAKIIAGLFHPWNGKVLFDGKEFTEYSRETLGNSIAYIDQLTHFFNGTIRDNLTLWDDTISEEEIKKATELACIDKEIESLSDGYLTILEEGGRNFSQGQRQRLEIARALILNPSILILDEATNTLDSQTEREILDNIFSLKNTCILVSHRLSIFEKSHRIVLIENGKIMQKGTHNELKQIPGLYKDMIDFEMQGIR